MNCRDFETAWQLRLDQSDDQPAALDSALDEHMQDCPDCQALAERYLLLERELGSWQPSPALTSFESARIRSKVVRQHAANQRMKGWLGKAGWVAAAALLAGVVWVEWTARRPRPDPQIVRTIPSPQPVEVARPLEVALVEAGSATLELAREASAPVARIGRDVFSTQELVDSDDLKASPSLLSGKNPLENVVNQVSAAEVLQTVGDQVRPISGSARHAFGFLLGPVSDKARSKRGTL